MVVVGPAVVVGSGVGVSDADVDDDGMGTVDGV